MHSFTPVFMDVARPWHVGVLYNRDARVARPLLGALRGEGDLVVGDNEPYAAGDLTDYSIVNHGERRGLPHVEIEIRQDLIADGQGQDAWAERLARLLPAAIARHADTDHTTITMRNTMRIRVGYELNYEFPQSTPMILTLNVHHSRVSDLAQPDYMKTTPAVPTAAYRDGFGNWCTRLVAPAGHFRVTSDAIVNDTGALDPVEASAVQHLVQQLPEETLVFLLGSRYCETDKMSQIAWDLFSKSPFGWATRTGDLRLRPPAHPVRLRVRQPHQDRLGGVQRTQGRLPRLRPPGHHPLPLHEHSRPLLHRLSG